MFSAGGASIYAQTIPLADTMYLSYIKGQYSGDAYFPEFSEQEWAVEKREDHPRFEFVVYRRKGVATRSIMTAAVCSVRFSGPSCVREGDE